MGEEDKFVEYCRVREIRVTRQRREILRMFLAAEGHVTAGDLYYLMRRRGVKFAYSTVYRTLRLLEDSGIARRIDLGERGAQFEQKLPYTHHDHLICVKCGRSIEFMNPTIERLQEKIAKEKHFVPQRHSLVIYGLCEHCR
ncbi:hypothetical protein AMJ40_00940 [candidate division TA06 bacterium DG_26]|uniref:Fur family transcriptional regulator n=1 Tax=candidate division TA06 bacterium DG_26 TaxID=1703771 RepID=A0A0S7WLQ4_UNCT6|nr:MAG: hypothetical protein AMJ40_00940 [candidate division TA06 bacterium DG_26]